MLFTIKCRKCKVETELNLTNEQKENLVKEGACDCGGELFNKITNTKEPFWKCTKHTYLPGVSR